MMLVSALLLTGCTTMTNVRFDVNADNATITIDGQEIGNGSSKTALSNAIWDNPEVIVTADGYNDYQGNLKKEIKVVNGIVGLFLFWPALLWSYGPTQTQNIHLTPAK